MEEMVSYSEFSTMSIILYSYMNSYTTVMDVGKVLGYHEKFVSVYQLEEKLTCIHVLPLVIILMKMHGIGSQ